MPGDTTSTLTVELELPAKCDTDRRTVEVHVLDFEPDLRL
jgi:hypothetical protein